MAKINANSQLIAEIIEHLSNEQLHLVDFDDVKGQLRLVLIQLKQSEKLQSELGELRGDYQNRIAGMVKAIAAVERIHNKSEDALVYLESLVELSATELIAEYRKTSARFRSAFPTTFGLGLNQSGGFSRLRNPEVYK